jgi:probable F420-dependent oxidoreductase
VSIAQRIGRIGIWSTELRFGDKVQAAAAAAELEQLGFGALWFPGGIGGDVTGDLDRLLVATKRVILATGILNVWKHDPLDVAKWWKGLSSDKQTRVLLGLGVSHSPLIGKDWGHPLAVMRKYLDALQKDGVPADSLCLAALGPKMLELARDRTAGAHPYLVTPEHTAQARKILGPAKLLAPEQGVVLESDPLRARTLAREALAMYLQLPNYANNWRRMGFTDEDIKSASDRLVDALFAWGSASQIAERVQAHLAAGADHVCLQVITGAGVDVAAALPAWRTLAAALL